MMALSPRSGWSTAATTKPHEATAALCWLPKRALPEKPWLWSTAGNGPASLAGRPTQVASGATSPESDSGSSALICGSSTSVPS